LKINALFSEKVLTRFPTLSKSNEYVLKMEFSYFFIRKIENQSLNLLSLGFRHILCNSSDSSEVQEEEEEEEEKVGNAYRQVSRDRGINQNESRRVCIACDVKEQNEGESRGSRILANLINGDIDGRAFLLRVNTSGDLSRLCRSPDAGPPRPELPLFVLLYFSFHCTISSLTLAPRRSSSRGELAAFFSHRISLSLFLSLSPPSLFLSLLSAHAFLRGEGARPGVSKYDTGIGYKETINHPSTRANGTGYRAGR